MRKKRDNTLHRRTTKNRLLRRPVGAIWRGQVPLIHIPDLPSRRGILPLHPERIRFSTVNRDWLVEDYYSDKSRIVFCSSFRRMMKKAQVFSLESNTSVRNRLTHSIEVADIGRTLARHVGRKLEASKIATLEEVECIESIVESACLLHDIGNPPFGHFGEEAIKTWFSHNGTGLMPRDHNELALEMDQSWKLKDLLQFDGNPQGFRIATKLHCEIDQYGLNLTCSTLLASVKYPNCGTIPRDAIFGKKLGVFSSERAIYDELVDIASIPPGHRYFLAYLMELADDICYCLSDIADSFEKEATNSREFKEEFAKICKDKGVDETRFIPKDPIINFGYQVGIRVARLLIEEASTLFVSNLDDYLAGAADELSKVLPSGAILECLKIFARRFIYTNREVQRIEIAGSRVVEGLLDHFGALLRVSRAEFEHFVHKQEMLKGRGLDTEWRIFNQLPKRMLRVYERQSRGRNDCDEWICRAKLIVDYISGMTDDSAVKIYQNSIGVGV
jgi:dGTPase